ncbi:MAG: SDR family NAD(P)-dependent oxidoreductase, partial [Bacteroidetes bacterium]|nr:SDR family NAD(P)-dependent oxidoreductase [Bacteroidota bacterium]
MNLSLSGKNALVCGGSQGIGAAAALELASLGANVTLMARDAERLNNILGQLP